MHIYFLCLRSFSGHDERNQRFTGLKHRFPKVPMTVVFPSRESIWAIVFVSAVQRYYHRQRHVHSSHRKAQSLQQYSTKTWNRNCKNVCLRSARFVSRPILAAILLSCHACCVGWKEKTSSLHVTQSTALLPSFRVSSIPLKWHFTTSQTSKYDGFCSFPHSDLLFTQIPVNCKYLCPCANTKAMSSQHDPAPRPPS